MIVLCIIKIAQHYFKRVCEDQESFKSFNCFNSWLLDVLTIAQFPNEVQTTFIYNQFIKAKSIAICPTFNRVIVSRQMFLCIHISCRKVRVRFLQMFFLFIGSYVLKNYFLRSVSVTGRFTVPSLWTSCICWHFWQNWNFIIVGRFTYVCQTLIFFFNLQCSVLCFIESNFLVHSLMICGCV